MDTIIRCRAATKQGSSKWHIHLGQQPTEFINRGILGELVEDGYVRFSRQLMGYIATDKLQKAVSRG